MGIPERICGSRISSGAKNKGGHLVIHLPDRCTEQLSPGETPPDPGVGESRSPAHPPQRDDVPSSCGRLQSWSLFHFKRNSGLVCKFTLSYTTYDP